jgi:hypothetical protein
MAGRNYVFSRSCGYYHSIGVSGLFEEHRRILKVAKTE